MQARRLRQMIEADRTLRYVPGTRADQAIWSRQIRAVVHRLARPRLERISATAREASARDGLACEHVLFDSHARGPFRGTVLGPEGPGPFPAVLVLGGKNAGLDQLTGDAPPDFPDRNVAEHLARNGFVTLSLDPGISGGLDPGRLSGRDESVLLAHAFALCGHSLLGALADDSLAALDWLRDLPQVDNRRIGVFGHSLGGAVALHVALLSATPFPVCVASHLGSYPALFVRLLTGYEGAVLPGILEYADLPDLFAALAPAPLQMQYGTADPFLDPADAHEAAETVRAAYSAIDAKDKLEVLELPMGHGTDREQAAAFFTWALARPLPDTSPVPAQRVHFSAQARRTVLDRVDSALTSGLLTQGPLVPRFEALARSWTGTDGMAVSSGSIALEIALRIVGVSGRTVLVPANTFFATAAAAVRAGASVRFVDMEPEGLGMDPSAFRAALADAGDVAAVVPVHIGGIVAPCLEPVLAECDRRGIPVIEDAAHALGSRLHGRPAGSLGRFGAFSFYPTKVVTTGEGGLLTCAGPGDLEAARRWRNHGKSDGDLPAHDRPGGGWRMSELQAAVGTADLERFATTHARRRAVAARYDELLAGLPGVHPHVVPAGAESNYYKYFAYLDDPARRADLKPRLRARHGVALAGETYPGLLCDEPFFRAARAGEYPCARWFAEHHIALPIYASMTEREQLRVIAALRAELR